jgi:homoserine O-acetyltransferase
LALTVALTACGRGDAPSRNADSEPPTELTRRDVLLDPGLPVWSQEAPDTFLAHFETSAGDFTMEVVRAWAPLGADRFFNLTRLGYYGDARFHRVVPGFIVQWGLAGDPNVTGAWIDRAIPDDTVVVASNVRGSVAFAFTEADTRSTQIYINLVDNVRLDAQGFPPFGRVIRGMDVVDAIFGGYGEDSGGGMRAGRQDSLIAHGNSYLDRAFPDLDRIRRVRVEVH